MDPGQVQIFHCMHRCVRRAFLCGNDPYSGVCYDHRRQWIRERLEFLASVFGIDCLTYTILENHLHLVLRSRPDVVAGWSDQEVARRWLRLFPKRRPKRRPKEGSTPEPTQAEINSIVNDREALAERRRRLSDISWWMRCTAENIAHRSNREDNVKGHFWESRYKSQQLIDEASLLACAAYVDLNPIRAAIAETLETSRFTGVRDRIDDLRERGELIGLSDHDWERSDGCRLSGWLSPIEIDEAADAIGCDSGESTRRASEKGFLPISLAAYLELLDWTGRQIRQGKRGAVPEHLAPILTRLGLSTAGWCELIVTFGRSFKRVVGTAEHLQEEAARRGQRWLQAPGCLG
jgi:REP element-mobilizing transposase RayT